MWRAALSVREDWSMRVALEWDIARVMLFIVLGVTAAEGSCDA